MTDPKPLSYKQKAFIEAYLETWNASEAARRAGYAHAWQAGSRMLRNVEVKAEIEQRLGEMAMSANEVLARLSEQARVSMKDFVLPGTANLDVAALQAKGHLVKSISHTRYGVRIELHDGQAALIQMGKAHNLFVERHELSGPNGGPIKTDDDGRFDRALSALAEALREIVPGTGAKQDGDVGSTE